MTSDELELKDLHIDELHISDFLSDEIRKDSETVSKVMAASCTTCTCCCSCVLPV